MTKKHKPRYCKDCKHFYLKSYGHTCEPPEDKSPKYRKKGSTHERKKDNA